MIAGPASNYTEESPRVPWGLSLLLLGSSCSLASLSPRLVAPREHPTEGAQHWTLAPAGRGAAALNGTHPLDKAANHREQQIRSSQGANDPTQASDPTHHVASFLETRLPSSIRCHRARSTWIGGRSLAAALVPPNGGTAGSGWESAAPSTTHQPDPGMGGGT